MIILYLVVTACLATMPETCAERLLPASAYQTEAACRDAGPEVSAGWADGRSDIKVVGWTCRSLTSLPALETKEIAPGVYAYRGPSEPISPTNRGAIANLGFVVGETVAVIDAGGSRETGERLFAAIRQVTDRPISHLVLTHMHPDHTFGAEVFREAGAEIVGHEALASGIARRAETWAESIPRQVGTEQMLGSRLVAPDRGIDAPETLDLGRATLRLVPVPTAHTDNDVTVFHAESGTLFTGDLVFSELAPVIDGSIRGWRAWLDAGPGPEVRQIVPGHGPVPLAWDTGTAPLRAYLAALEAEVRAAIAAGKSLSVAGAELGVGLGEGWVGFEESNPRNASVAFTELEWE